MVNYARAERLALAAALRRTGPDAPTLGEGWDASDLAVHLVVRDRYPSALPGNAAPELAARVPLLERRAAAREAELKALPWDQLVGMVAAGPKRRSLAAWGPVDRLMNTAEYFVHHEDIRRAADEWVPRALPADEEEQLGRMVGLLRRRMVGKPGYAEVEGPNSELLLYYFGRQSVALVKPVKA